MLQVSKIDPVSMKVISTYRLKTARQFASVIGANGYLYVIGGVKPDTDTTVEM